MLLLAVTKTATLEQIRQAVALGMDDLGENRVQMLAERARALADLPQIRWHMIGHLQRNKVRDVLPWVKMVHSVDSQRLAMEIDKSAGARGVPMPVLLEVNAGGEEQKYGVLPDDALALCEQIQTLANLQLCGVMSMAPLSDDVCVVRAAFARARGCFEAIRGRGLGGDAFAHLSMGMSHDFELAIEEGATMIRVGSFLFGSAGPG